MEFSIFGFIIISTFMFIHKEGKERGRREGEGKKKGGDGRVCLIFQGVMDNDFYTEQKAGGMATFNN